MRVGLPKCRWRTGSLAKPRSNDTFWKAKQNKTKTSAHAVYGQTAAYGGGERYVPQVALTLYELGRCVRKAGRPEEAEGYLRRALEIEEAKPEPDEIGIAMTLHSLGRCSAVRCVLPFFCLHIVSPAARKGPPFHVDNNGQNWPRSGSVP